jgi:beta-glucanase (GH16 family)
MFPLDPAAPLNARPVRARGIRRILCAAAGLLILGSPLSRAQVGGIAPKFLVDPKSPAAASQITPGDNDHGQTTTTLGADGVTVNIAGGPAGYPGIRVKSETGSPWDLTPWGHVEAKITNLGADKLSMGMRVDNQNDGSSCNAEILSLQPGESKVIKVIFGYSYGFKKAFALDPGSVIQLLFVANGKKEAPRSFRIEDLQASGSAGEQPPFDPSTFRVKPDNGAILGGAVKIDAAKQVIAKSGAKADLAPDGTLKIDFAGGSKDEQVLIQPTVGSWDLTDKFQVQVKLKNTGQSPVTPKVRVESKGGASDSVAAGAPIPPGGEGVVTVPFTAVIPPVIPNDPKQDVFGPGSWAEQNWSPQAGTGTKFTSDWAKGVTILTDKTDGAKSLAVTSVVANVPEPAKLPDWLGKRPPVDGDWVQTFDEEFDGPAIDFSKWNIYSHNYWDKRTHFSKDNTLLKDGTLSLHYEKKTGYHNDNPNDTKTVGKTDYACGFADTYGKWRQLYGYFEARVKLPKAPGLWPAFWTMPDRGPETGRDSGSRASTKNGGMEHDILEFLSGWGPYRYNTAFHWDGYGKEHKSAGTACNYVLPDKDGFITTGVYWIPGLAVYYAQGKEILRWESPRVCSVPSYIMFNFVSGGWDNQPLEDSKLPDDFVIDYVRAWQRKDLASPVDGPMPNKGLPSSVAEEATK